MIDAKFIELMNRDIDGAISPSERAELRTFLAGNAEARQNFDELVRMTARLKAMPKVAAPAELKPSIMSQIPAQRVVKSAPQRGGFLQKYANWFVPSPVSYAVSGAMAGALVMAFVFNVFQGNGSSVHDGMSGTMAPVKSATAVKIDRQTLFAGGASAVIITERIGDQVFTGVEVTAPGNATVRISFDQSDLSLAGFTNESGDLVSFEKNEQVIEFTSMAYQSVRFAFRDQTDANSRIRVEFSHAGAGSEQELATGTTAVQK